jgi:glycosyltransferase involved in cell wall biosynthesis
MNKIRVLYSFPLRMGIPGIGMTAWYQVSSLLNQDIKVSLFCGSCEKVVQDVECVRETLRYGAIPLPIKLIGRNRACALHDWKVARILESNYDKFDIVHCWPSGSLETLKSAKSLGIQTVLERPSAHTRYVFEVTRRECDKLGIELNHSHYAAFDRKRLCREEEEFEVADKLLCPSDFVIQTFLKYGFCREKLLRHQYGYNPAVFSADCRKGPGSDESTFRLLYVGDCSPLKGLHYALRAWLGSRASQRGKFLICGKMDAEYHNVIKKWLDHPSVEYLGFEQNISEVMRGCDALVLPSLAEGSALVTYEARACGCILLVSSASGAVCEHMMDGLIHEPGDVNTLRDQIDLLASNRKGAMRLLKNSMKEVPRLTWMKAGELLRSLYSEVLRSG